MADQKRPYRMKRRAELEEETRRRITESAVSLHEKVGPAQTSITAIADLAGVRRSTVYRHFPDEDTLFAACSSHWRALNPPPDLATWASSADPGERTEAALGELYAFYEGRAECRRACCETKRSCRRCDAGCATSTPTYRRRAICSWPDAVSAGGLHGR